MLLAIAVVSTAILSPGVIHLYSVAVKSMPERLQIMRERKVATKSSGAVKRSSRTAVNVDEKLAAKVKRISKSKTTAEAVERALDYYARSHNYAEVLSLYGTGGVAEGYDPKVAYSRS